MPVYHVERLKVSRPWRRRPGRGSRLWREWCFIRVAFRHFRLRLLLMVAILLIGGLLFVRLEPEKHHSLLRSIYYTWSLVFGEPPEAFPKSWVLKSMFFIMPILGLTVIIEGIIDFALMMRDRRRFERSWCEMMASSMKDHIVIVGCGRLGYRTFKLLRKLGEAVVVIERDEHNQFLEEIRRDGAPLFIGDARREALLEDANVAHARTLILATDDDLANLEIALDARRLRPRIRVVMRMFDQNMADKMAEGFDIHLAMSQSAISAPTFATAAIEPTITASYMLDDQLVVMQEWYAHDNGRLSGRTVGELMGAFGVGIVEHKPAEGESCMFPPPATVVGHGDRVVVQSTFDVMADLQRDALTRG